MKQNKDKAVSFKIPKAGNCALRVQVDEAAYFYSQLHYHPEFQITAIIKGEGVLYAGNNMSVFSKEEVFVIGANVPHLLKNSSNYYERDSPGVTSVSLFFDDHSFGPKFFELEELNGINEDA